MIIEDVNSVVLERKTRSFLSPTKFFPGFQVKYPEVLTRALCLLFDEYNHAFQGLVDLNREWNTDYQYSVVGNQTVNLITQIDMCGIDPKNLSHVDGLSLEENINFLKNRIFEVENGWAVYQILNSVCKKGNKPSFYGTQTKAMLDELRLIYQKPIALLAVTYEKYESVKACEFGVGPEGRVSPEDVFNLSGFDRLFGPDEFKQYIKDTEGVCEYLLFVRASDPIEKLKKPNFFVEQPLLSDTNLRKLIKAHSITLNVDNPDWEKFSKRRLNDTKWYMPEIEIGFPISTYEETQSSLFDEYLKSKGSSLDDVMSSSVKIRAKPIQGTFGCYGHIRGFLSDKNFRQNLRKNLRQRGPYILQIEKDPPLLRNEYNNIDYAYVDRVFVGKIGCVTTWMGGHRECLPCSSQEVKSGRLHGNSEAVIAEIL